MKRGRRKGGNKDKVFGCDLLEHLSTTNQEIPQVLRSCSEFIEEHGIVDGIYRLSGVSSNTQKLRSEFDSEGTPDLYKDIYLQDIHCVSSLCKAYFRELPNPLLTYQLYDHFAEAVAVQLEDERLVKIKDVLKELPIPHYKTLEYLMKHLVRMSKHSDQTNMHARNLAIVWAPNLLRSKDIEASGFNGTAAFMEVRVQSIVVEFILTHVAQLFPDSCTEGLTLERRKSLPSPTLLSGQEDQFFKAIPFQYPGNMSPGDGPPPMRPYHAIIDGTDKRKGSLKGRKWRSIFNLGGRLQDPRKKNKYTTKEKEKTSLRPAKSMDSLSSGPYTLEDSRHPSSHLSPLVPSSGTSEGGNPSGGGMGSGYAVTYRRTGGASVSMVSGGSGTQGTYKSLDVGGTAPADRSQAASQGAATKAERRAGMHISGPFSVTVPLHITSGLALGVLHGGRNEEEQSQQSTAEEEQSKKVKQEKAGEKDQPGDGEQEQTEQKTGDNQRDHDKDEVKIDKNKSGPSKEEEENEAKARAEEGGPKERRESQDEEENSLSVEEESSKIECVRDRPSLTEDTADSDYMVMKPGVQHDFEMTHNPQYMEEELPLDFQDTFGFLDLMDTSVQTSSNQLNEFSVEPPGFEEEEEDGENDEQNQSPPCPPLSHPDTEKLSLSSTNFPHRPLPGKSHSLPYKSRPFLPVQSSSSEEDDFIEPDDEDEDASYYDKDEYEDMFCKSLPSACHFQALNWTCTQTVILNTTNSSVDSHANNPLERPNQTHNIELTKSSQDSPPINQSENLTWTDTENIPDNGMDIHAIDLSLNKDDLSPLPLETLEHLSMDKNMIEDKSTNDAKEESGSEKAEHISEPVQETNKVEGTDNREDTHTCCQEETQYMDNEDEEDTYFGPDATSTSLEPDNNEMSYTNDKLPIEEELTSVDRQQPGPEGCPDIEASEVALTHEPILLPGTMSLASQQDTKELSMEQTLTLHKDKQGQTNDSEVRDEQSKTREVVKEVEEMIGNISVTEENSVKQDLTESEHTEGEKGKEEASTVEVKCKISKESNQEHERVDKGKSEEIEEEIKYQVDEDVLQRETEMTEGEQLTILERNEEDVEELTVRKGKEGGDQGEENDGQIEEETEARKESHLGETEIKEGSVPEETMVREVSEDDNRLSENSNDSTESGTLLEEPQGKTEDKTENEDLNAEAAISVVEKPLRPPRMKERKAGKDVSLGPGVGRTVLKSKQAPIKVYQVKAVPVVPPKPQHSKITAFKQQFQQKDSERLHLDRGLQSRDVVRNPQQGDTKCSDKDKEPEEVEKGDLRQNHDHQKTEQGRDMNELKVEENKTVQEKTKLKDTPSEDGSLKWEPGKGEDGEDQGERRGTWDGGSRRKDGQKELDREIKRASGISICFDEAVARATGKRCREKEERFIDLQWDKGDQKEGSIQSKKEEEGETD